MRPHSSSPQAAWAVVGSCGCRLCGCPDIVFQRLLLHSATGICSFPVCCVLNGCVCCLLLPTRRRSRPVCPAAKVSSRLIGLRRSLMQWTDKRVGLMNEIINSMSMIKFMAWEHPFRVGVTGCVSCGSVCLPLHYHHSE